MSTLTKSVKLSVATLAIMNVTAVVSLRGLPAEAEYGISSAFYYLFAALVFLIPTSFVAAEPGGNVPGQARRCVPLGWRGFRQKDRLPCHLAAMGGEYHLVPDGAYLRCRIARIHRNGQCSRYVARLEQVLHPRRGACHLLGRDIHLTEGPRLGEQGCKDRWSCGYNYPGLPAGVAGNHISIGGGKSQMDFGGNFFPDITKLDNLVLASSIFLFYAGMEMTGIHVKDMENPSRNYPRAVFMGAIITVLIFVLGTFALGIVIPQKDINLTQSLLVGFDNYFKFVGASWLSPVIAVALAFECLQECSPGCRAHQRVSLPWARPAICHHSCRRAIR